MDDSIQSFNAIELHQDPIDRRILDYTRQYQWRTKRVLQMWFWRETPGYMLEIKRSPRHMNWSDSPYYKVEREYWIAVLIAQVKMDIRSLTCYPAMNWITCSFHLPPKFNRPPQRSELEFMWVGCGKNRHQELVKVRNRYVDEEPHIVHAEPFKQFTYPDGMIAPKTSLE